MRQPLTRLHTAILLRPWRVIAASALLLALALAAGTQVEFRTSREELAPPGDPDQARWAELSADWSGSESLIAVVMAREGMSTPPPELRAFADRLAESFRADPRVAEVFHRVDADWVLRHGLWLAPPRQVSEAAASISARPDLLARLAAVSDLAALNAELSALLRDASAAVGAAAGAGEGKAVLDALTALLRFQSRWLDDPALASAELVDRLPWNGPAAGYLASHDGSMLFLLVSPRDRADGLSVRRDLLGALAARAEEVGAQRAGVRVAFTGQPAIVVEEMDTVRRDTLRTSVVAVLGVTLLTFFVFRWRTHAVLVLLALGCGIAWAFGAVWLEFGYLNMITSSFISTLVGVGVAYGIHPVSEYELEGAHTRDPLSTLRQAFHRTGAAVTVAALTTAAAFFSIRLMRFRGFGELGIVAGVGVLLCLAAAMITLPAILAVHGLYRQRRRETGTRGRAAVDRFWVERFAGRVCRFPRTVTVAALLLTAVAGWAASGIGFDTDILALLPRDAESLRLQRVMVLESDLTPLYNIVVAENVDELHSMRRAALDEPTIARFDSALRFLPEDPHASAAAVDAARRALNGLSIAATTTPLAAEPLARALSDLEAALADAADDAFVAGHGDVVGSLEEARAAAAQARGKAAAADAARVAEWNVAQEELFAVARDAAQRLDDALTTDAPDVAKLPPTLRGRFFTASGRPLGFLMPQGNVFDAEYLDAYVAASRRVSPEATGFPVVFDKMAARITGGFYRAVALGAALVVLILLLDYRSPRDAALALIPLGVGVVWMMGGMRLVGISFNFANLVAVPLIIGVGIDNGVHVIHRVRLEGREGMDVVLRHTGRAILIASLTTMIGFGSLALAAHRGIASLGIVLLLGVGACLITSTVVLPNLLVAFGVVRR